MIFSREKVNTGRQIEIDLLKAFTVVFSMIIIHVYDYSIIPYESDFTWWLDDIFGGILGAPAFMFCMGIGMEYSRNDNPKQNIIRGLKLLTIGQLLNLFRYGLILLIAGAFDREYSYVSGQALNFSSDIMQLAGLSFILMGLLKQIKFKNWMILLFAIGLNLLGMALAETQTGIYWIDQILGFFWGTETESFFPLFNWFIFIAAGRCFGELYTRVQNKGRLFAILVPVGLMMFVTVFYMQIFTKNIFFQSFDESYRGFSFMRLPDALADLLIIPGLLGVFYFISRILPEKTCEILSHPSKHINQYYCISWWWIMTFYLHRWANNLEGLLSVWFNILALTVITVVVYNRYYKERMEAFCAKHRTLLTILVWVITLGLATWAFATCDTFPNQYNGYLMN